MARAGQPRPVRRDDRQGDRRPHPHAQDQGLARGRPARARANSWPAAPTAPTCGRPSCRSRRPAARSTTSSPRARSSSPSSCPRSCAEPTAPPSTARWRSSPSAPPSSSPRATQRRRALNVRAHRRCEHRSLESAAPGLNTAVGLSRTRLDGTGGHREALFLFPLVRRLPGAHRVQPQGPRATTPSRSTSRRRAGSTASPSIRAINPQMRVPALKLDSGEVLTQSLAIIEYLDETHPQPPLLPRDPIARAKVRALAQLIACDIHPLNNVAPLRYLKNALGQDQAKIDAWYHHWIIEGFDALETMIGPGPTPSAPTSRWPTSASCRRSPMRAASRCRSTAIPRSSPSMPPAPSFPPSTRRGRRISPTRSDPMRRPARPARVSRPLRQRRTAISTSDARRHRRDLDDRHAAVVLRDGGRDPRAVRARSPSWRSWRCARSLGLAIIWPSLASARSCGTASTPAASACTSCATASTSARNICGR